MTDQEILEALKHPKEFPAEALALAGERRDTVAPLLIEEIAAWAEGRHAPVDENYYFLPDIAFHLLAEWRETRAFKPLLALMRTPHGDFIADTLDEEGPLLLARLFNGDTAVLTGLVLDITADEYVRATAFDAYLILVLDGMIAREAAHAFLLQLFETLPHAFNYVWIVWARAVAELLFDDLAPQAKRLFEAKAIDPAWMGYEDFEMDVKAVREGRGSLRPYEYKGVAETIAKWRFSDKEDEKDEDVSAFRGKDIAIYPDLFKSDFDSEPAYNPHKDIGRNDPCPCGSGKKFKKCCLEKDELGTQ